MPTIEDRFWAKVDKSGKCWLWTACVTRNGYGLFTVRNRSVRAHRFAYELLVGPIPDGLELDHVRERGCRHRHCVNPTHLESVTHKVNLHRGDSPVGLAIRQTHCKYGHEFTSENTYIDAHGHRICRICRRARNRAYKARKRSRSHA